MTPRYFLCAFAFFAVVADPLLAQPYYQGKEIKLLVGSGVGGGYDAYARLLGRYWGRYIPGNPSIILQNLPTAASLQAMNLIANSAPRDGTTLAAVQNHIAVEPILGVTGPKENARYDSRRVNWIGSMAKEYPVVVVSSRVKADSFGDFRTISIPVGASGPATSGAVYSRMLNELVGTKFKIIDGYKDNPQMIMALESGEIDGRIGWFLSSLMTSSRQALERGDLKIIAQIALERNPVLPNVPLVTDFIDNSSSRSKLEFALSWLPMGRPFVAPPDVPPGRLAELRESFMRAARDPELLNEANRLGLEISPMSGEQMQMVVERLYSTPPELASAVRSLMVPN